MLNVVAPAPRFEPAGTDKINPVRGVKMVVFLFVLLCASHDTQVA